MTESFTFASIFFLGCLHALEPGHGKTFLLAYTIGQKLDLKKISSLNEIISYQLNSNGIYGSALYTNVYPYKIALYSKIKPEIVVIGSSTVLQFRENFFNGKIEDPEISILSTERKFEKFLEWDFSDQIPQTNSGIEDSGYYETHLKGTDKRLINRLARSLTFDNNGDDADADASTLHTDVVL